MTRMFVVMIAMLACACGDSNEPDPPLLPTAQITVSSGQVSEELTVELATTTPQHQTGLMHRQSMPEDRGMLFIFDPNDPNGRTGGFYMRNTYIPLDIAYLDKDGTVLQIVHGKPLDETILTPDQPYWHALEVNEGWFERHGLGVGAKVELPTEALTAAQAPTPTAAP